MRPRQRLRHIQRLTQVDMIAVERLSIAHLALPHLQAGANRLLQPVEALAHRRERQPEPRGLLRIVAGTDAEHRPAAGEHVERRHHLRQQPGGPVGGRRGEREQPDPAGPRRDRAKRRIRFDLVLLHPAHDRVLPEVIGHRDRIEPRHLGGLNDFEQRRAEPRRSAPPIGRGNVQAKFHRGLLSGAGLDRATISPQVSRAIIATW